MALKNYTTLAAIKKDWHNKNVFILCDEAFVKVNKREIGIVFKVSKIKIVYANVTEDNFFITSILVDK